MNFSKLITKRLFYAKVFEKLSERGRKLNLEEMKSCSGKHTGILFGKDNSALNLLIVLIAYLV